MKSLERMTIEELEAHRDQLQVKIEELKAQFVAAGKVLDIKRSLQTINVDDDLAAAEAQVVRLKNLKTEAKALGLSSKED